MSASLPIVSVIIASYNARRTIRACLDSLHHQRTPYDYEVVLADSSKDETADIICHDYPWVRLIRLRDRTFPGPARNAAVTQARGAILAFVDTDCTVAPDWIDRIVAAHRDGYSAVAGPVLNGTPQSYVGTAEYFCEFSEFSPRQQSRDCRTAPTCNLSLQRDIFDTIGGFAQINTAEDLLLCYHIRQRGHTIRFDCQVAVFHHNRTSLKAYLNNQMSLGFGSAMARRLVDMTGSALIKSAVLRVLIPVIKTLILLQRTARYGLRTLLHLMVHLPLIFLGSCYYAIGFWRGAKAPISACPPGTSP